MGEQEQRGAGARPLEAQDEVRPLRGLADDLPLEPARPEPRVEQACRLGLVAGGVRGVDLDQVDEQVDDLLLDLGHDLRVHACDLHLDLLNRRPHDVPLR